MITLKQYAAAMAAIDSGKPIAEVVGTFELHLTEWSKVHDYWRTRLRTHADRGEPADFDSYMATYERQRQAFDREAAETTKQQGDRSDEVARDMFAGTTAPAPCSVPPDDEPTSPMTPFARDGGSDSIARTEPMPSEVLAAFQAALGAAQPALPFRASDWDLERFAILEARIQINVGAVGEVLNTFGINFQEYVALRKRFADGQQAAIRAIRNNRMN